MGHVQGQAVPGGPLQTFARAAVDVRCSSADVRLAQCTGVYSAAPRSCYPARVICHSHLLGESAEGAKNTQPGGGSSRSKSVAWPYGLQMAAMRLGSSVCDITNLHVVVWCDPSVMTCSGPHSVCRSSQQTQNRQHLLAVRYGGKRGP
jgi:hypothetical protein